MCGQAHSSIFIASFECCYGTDDSKCTKLELVYSHPDKKPVTHKIAENNRREMIFDDIQ